MAKNKTAITPSLLFIGRSAGSLKVLLRLLDELPDNFRVPILVVLHRDPQGSMHLVNLLQGRSQMPVKEIEDKDLIEPGHLYLCPPDYHVLTESDGTLSLDYSEKENFSRPSIDVALRAAA